MPRNVNPSTLTPGGGLAPPGTVEDNSLRYPERDVDPLRAHIHDPVRAHMASSIGIVDEGHYFTSDDVEGALQELGAGEAAGYANRQNGWVAAGTSDFTTAAVVAGATVTLSGTWQAITNTGLVDVSGFAITLGGGAGLYWVYLDATTNTLVQLAVPAVPDITSNENIPVGVFAYDGAGSITLQIDARFFVRNDNRKITYTVRGDGAEKDANSEGAFATIEGAFSWLQAYTTGAGGVSQKSRLTLRGTFTIADTLTIPVDNLEIVGEDGAEITFTSGAATTLFDLDGKNGVSFRDISFVCGTASSRAIGNGAGACGGFSVDRCQFTSGTQDWDFGIGLGQGSGSHLWVTNSQFSACGSAAISFLGHFTNVTVSGNQIDGFPSSGVGPSTGIGIRFKSRASSGEAPANLDITGNFIRRCAFGISIEGRYDERAYNDFTVAALPAPGDTVTVTDAAGTNHVLTATAGPAVATDEFLIGANVNATATNIISAINDPTNSFYENVARAASPGAGAVRLYAVPQGEVGNAFTLATSNAGAFNIASANFAGGFDGSIQGATISRNTVRNCAAPLSGFIYETEAAVGIGLSFTRDSRVVDNTVIETGIEVDNTGTPSIPAGGESTSGITVWNSTRFTVDRNTVLNTSGTLPGGGQEQRGIYVITGNQGIEAACTNEVTESSVSDNQIVWSLEDTFAATPNATFGTYGILFRTSVIAMLADSTSGQYEVNGLKVCRNGISKCGGTGIQFQTLARSAYLSTLVDQNVVTEAVDAGITFDIPNFIPTAGPSGFLQTSVTGNSVNGVTNGPGIIVSSTRDVASNQIIQFTVQGNQIANTTGPGFSFDASAGHLHLPNVSQFDVLDNEMFLVGTSGDTTSAISFSGVPTDDLTVANVFENVRVNGNSILDSGGGQAHAIDFALTNWSPLNVEMSNNTVSGTDSSPSPGGGIRMNVVSTNPTPTNHGITGVEAADNTLFLSGNLPVGTASIEVTAPFTGGIGQKLRFLVPNGGISYLEAVAGAPGTDEFQATGAINTDAIAIRNALNNPNNSFYGLVTASITTAGTVDLVADEGLPGSMCGWAGPTGVGAPVNITPFTGTGVGVNERRATFPFFVYNNAGFLAGSSAITLDAPGVIGGQSLTFGPGFGQIPIGGSAAITAGNIVTAITNTPAFALLCTAEIYAGDPSGQTVLLTAGDSIPGRLGNYANFTFYPTGGSQDAINYGNDDQYFSYGEDDAANGVSIEADGLIVQANIQRNTVTYSLSNATGNRRPAFLRAKQAKYPYSLNLPSFAVLTVAEAENPPGNVPPAFVGDGQTFTIDDGVNPAVTFEYVIPSPNSYNPSHVPINLDVGTLIDAVARATARAIAGVAAAGRLSVAVQLGPALSGDIYLAALPVAAVSGSITVSGLPLVTTNWALGNSVGTDNDFGQVYGLNIEDNDFLGGIGSQIEVLNGFVLQGVSFSGNRVGRRDVDVPPCNPGPRYSGYYHGFSTFIRSGFISLAGPSLTGTDQLIGVVVTDNDFTNLGHGAISIYKDETKNNLYPFVLDTSITNNRVFNCGSSNVSPTMIGLEVWGYADFGTIASATISGNSIENSVVRSKAGRPLTFAGSLPVYDEGNTPAHITVRAFVTATDISVRNNTILGGSSTAPVTDGAIQVASAIAMFPGVGMFCRDFGITDNRIHGVSLTSTSKVAVVGATHIFVGSSVSATVGVTGLDISRNVITSASGTYEYWDSVLTVNSDNGAIPLVGAIFVVQTGVVLAASLNNNVVDLNSPIINILGAVPGLYLNSHIGVVCDLGGSVGVLGASSISGNQLSVVNDHAFTNPAKHNYAILVPVNALNVKVDSNEIVLSGQNTAGLAFGASTATFLGGTISSNSITATNNNPGNNQYFLSLLMTLPGFVGSEISNNTFASAYGNPFDVGIYADTKLDQVVISGNNIVANVGSDSQVAFERSTFVGNTTTSDVGFRFRNNVTTSVLSGNTATVTSIGFGFNLPGPGGASLSGPAITGNVVWGDGGAVAAATGGTAVGPSGTCTGNVGYNLGGGGNTWDSWANSGGGKVAVYRVGATPLND